MERTVFIGGALNAKIHLLSGIVIGAGALLLVKQMCNQKNKKHNGSTRMHESMPATDTTTD